MAREKVNTQLLDLAERNLSSIGKVAFVPGDAAGMAPPGMEQMMGPGGMPPEGAAPPPEAMPPGPGGAPPPPDGAPPEGGGSLEERIASLENNMNTHMTQLKGMIEGFMLAKGGSKGGAGAGGAGGMALEAKLDMLLQAMGMDPNQAAAMGGMPAPGADPNAQPMSGAMGMNAGLGMPAPAPAPAPGMTATASDEAKKGTPADTVADALSRLAQS